MTTDQWFTIILFAGVYLCGLILLDGAHKTRIGELKSIHREQISGLRSYIRTLNRERKWLEAELAKVQRERELAQAQEAAFDPFVDFVEKANDPAHIQWLPFDAWLADTSSSTAPNGLPNGEPTLKPPSEEFGA